MSGLGIDATTGLYFVFGALGTFFRVWLSPTLESNSRRMVVETVCGGVAGFVVPYFGAFFAGAFGMTAEQIGSVPPIIKAGLMLLAAYTGSFTVGELLARRAK